MKSKKNYRDSLFRNIFKNKPRLQSLYKGLSGRDVPLKDIRINTLKGVFFNDIKNDISFEAGGRLVILIEHQSTWNPNMPLRFLWYLAKLYGRKIDKDMPYKSTLIKLAAPEFYVLYNGTKDEPPYSEQHLSDAFAIPSDTLELTVKTYNINYDENNELLQKCYELRCYSIFVEEVKKALAEGQDRDAAIKHAIRYCITHDLLADYFEQNEREVFDMVTFKWDDKRALEVAREEAKEAARAAEARGEIRGEARGESKARYEMALDMLKEKTPVGYIVKISKLSLEQVKELAKKHNLAIVG